MLYYKRGKEEKDMVVNEWWNYEYNTWIDWEDLTPDEQDQARRSYIGLRADEEQVPESEIDGSYVVTCRFERQTDGYIFVDL